MIPLEWVEGNSVCELIRSNERLLGPRRTRLLAVAFCDRVTQFIPHDICQKWLEVARSYADKKAQRVELTKAYSAAKEAYSRFGQPTELRGMSIQYALCAIMYTLNPARRYYAHEVADYTLYAASYGAGDRAGRIDFGHDFAACASESSAQLRVLRDVLGRPDDLPAGDVKAWQGWNGGLVRDLAQGFYDDREFDRLPVLGDALEDAGCMYDEVLAHCRGSGPHTRGCWVVDLLLGLA